jgi:glycosyltransferase involved in cell wall biosynthesis
LRLTIVASHPVQYQAPLYRALARRLNLTVLYAYLATPQDQAIAGFGVGFDWDVDLTSGYDHVFLRSVSPGPARSTDCETLGVAHELRRQAPDAVLLMGWHLKSYWEAIWATRRAGIPTMVRGDSHLATPRSQAKTALKELVYPRFLRLFDAALYVGQRSRAYYEHYRYPADRLFFSPHCVDTAWFADRATDVARARLRGRLGLSKRTTAVLFAGRLIALKRPLDLIAAAALCRAKGQDVAVIVAGDGEQRRVLIDAAANAKVPLHMLGFCNQTEMPAAYAAADVLVLPSDTETWGLVANEALACGRPILVSNGCGCADDLAADGQVGRTFAVGDVAALSERVSDIIAHPPNPEEILAVSNSYSIEAAIHGIRLAIGHVQQSGR